MIARYLEIILCVAFLTVVSACGASDSQADAAAADTTHVYHPYDRDAYDLGQKRAADMLRQCTDSVAMQDYLLEFAAQTYEVEHTRSHRSALDFRRGFLDYVRFTDPETASRIF